MAARRVRSNSNCGPDGLICRTGNAARSWSRLSSRASATRLLSPSRSDVVQHSEERLPDRSAPVVGIERLERALALFVVVAWHIAHLVRPGRCWPDLDTTLFFDPDEIRGAYLLTRTPQPALSSLNNMLRLVARLSGFLGRKGDGHPGVKAIWEGLQKVQVAAETLQGLRFEGG
jgi:hypothetical protein